MNTLSSVRVSRRVGSVLLVGVAAILGLAACSTGSTDSAAPTVTITKGPTTQTSAPSTPAPTTSSAAARPVHIKTLNSDGQTYGVGMPVVAYFSKKPTDASTLVADTKVTANGQPLQGGWYFEYSSAIKGYPVEGHWRPVKYWQAHSQIHVDLPMKGKSAGTGLAYDDSLTLDFTIGASHIVNVSNRAHKLTVVNDGKPWGTFPVSLGARQTPTANGIKVIMEKGLDISMRGPGYYDPHVKYTQRLTYGGEYLHAAPWNCTSGPGCIGPANNIGHADSSNGCTNLTPADAQKLYGFLRIGDVVKFLDANGPKMQLGDGYGDWNLSWTQWSTGGLISTT